MLELITDPNTIEQETGFNPLYSLFAKVTIDAPLSGTPVLLKTECKGAYVIVRHVGAQSIQVRNARMLYYSPYFTFSNLVRNHDMPKTWIDVITKYFSGDGAIRAYGDISFERYRLLCARFNVTLESSKEIWEPTFAYAIDKSTVLSAFAEDSEAFGTKAEQFCDQLAHGDKIRGHLGKTDNRFELFDQMLVEQGLETLLLSSPLNIQEISSLGMYVENRPDILGVYKRGDPRIYILSKQKLEDKAFSNMGNFDNQRKALEAITGRIESIGIDGVHLPMQQFLSLNLAEEQVVDASDTLRLWRERRAGLAELSYYLAAVQATRYAMDGAMAFAVEEINQRNLLTELDVHDKQYSLFSEFAAGCELPGSIRFIGALVHAGDRGAIPDMPTDYALTQYTKTLHIDSGALVVDSGGRLRGVSDIARITAFTGEGCELNDFMLKLARDVFIPAAVPGLRGEDMYYKYVNWLEPHVARFKEIGVMPVNAKPQDITRDIGHGLGLQEPITLWFKAGNKVELRIGMICTVEIKWPFNEMCLGVEDEFLITEEGGVNITI